MFTLNQEVVCINDDNQPTLQYGAKYTVRAVGARGIRVRNAQGDIRYEFLNARFEGAVSVVVAPAMPEVTRAAIQQAEHNEVKWVYAILILDGNAYSVKVNPDEDDNCTGIRDMNLMSSHY